MKASVLALFVACLGVAPLSAQQVYTWTDANGVKHFSDTPPPANVKESKKVNVTTSAASEDEGSSEAAAAAPKEGPTMAAAAGYSAEDIKRNCDVAKKNADVLEKSRPAEGADADVQIAFQQNLNKVQSQVKLFCG